MKIIVLERSIRTKERADRCQEIIDKDQSKAVIKDGTEDQILGVVIHEE